MTCRRCLPLSTPLSLARTERGRSFKVPSSVGSKRSSSSIHAPIPASKRTCPTSPTKNVTGAIDDLRDGADGKGIQLTCQVVLCHPSPRSDGQSQPPTREGDGDGDGNGKKVLRASTGRVHGQTGMAEFSSPTTNRNRHGRQSSGEPSLATSICRLGHISQSDKSSPRCIEMSTVCSGIAKRRTRCHWCLAKLLKKRPKTTAWWSLSW